MYDDYVKNPGFGVFNPVVRGVFKRMVKKLRVKDYEGAQRPEYFVTISGYAKELIEQYYKRDAVVIHPPVEIEEFRSQEGISRTRVAPARRHGRSALILGRNLRNVLEIPSLAPYYIITSRQVNWKRIDLAVKACMRLGRKLLVVGEGPEHGALVKMARESEWVEFVPLLGKDRLAELLAGAKGYLFPSMEPFGIAPVEALASGCPVIAFGKGGALDYVRDGDNGVLFARQTVKSLVDAIERFEKMKFDRNKIAKSVVGFDAGRFDKEILDYVKKKLK